MIQKPFTNCARQTTKEVLPLLICVSTDTLLSLRLRANALDLSTVQALNMFVEVLLSAVFKWPQELLNMLSSPKISQRLMLNHGWESLDTLGTVRAWAQHVERCCANALDFVEPHMDDRETKEMLSRVERKVWPVSNLTQQDSAPLNRVFNALNLLRACTVDKSSAFARGFRNGYFPGDDAFLNVPTPLVAKVNGQWQWK